MAQLERGSITAVVWRDGMRRLLTRYHTAGLMVGMGVTELPEEALALLVQTLEVGQFPYLDNFYTVVVAASEYNPAWMARAMLYALSPKTSYWEGEVYRQAGRFLPLPAQPAQGTTCLTNCGCAWRIVTLAEGDYDAYWERGKDDSCQVCLEREETWNPLRIRDGVLMD
jgi:hypothetical protein